MWRKRGLCIFMACISLTGCAALFPDTSSISSAAGEPPGYYPGLEQEVYSYEKEKWKKWVYANRVRIADILNKANQIKAGKLEPGCVGLDINTCVASLSQTLAIADNYQFGSLNAPQKFDVNGNPIFVRDIDIKGFVPVLDDPASPFYKSTRAIKIRFVLTLREDKHVESLMAFLPRDPIFAKTQEEYDATGFYEVIKALGKEHCPNLTKNQAARFIENRVKQDIDTTGRETSCDDTRCTSSGGMASGHFKFCGQTMRFSSVYGRSTDLITRNNTGGAFGGMSVTFK